MVMEVGISVQSRANFTGVTSSWGSRSTCAWSMRRQKEARRSKGSVSSIMQRKMSSTSSCLDISSMARYWRSRHIRAKSFSWYLRRRRGSRTHGSSAGDIWKRFLRWALPVVGEDVFIVSVSLSGFLGQLADALILLLVGLIRPHQPDLKRLIAINW